MKKNKTKPYYRIVYKDQFTHGRHIAEYTNKRQARRYFEQVINFVKKKGFSITSIRQSPRDRSFHLIKYVFKDDLWQPTIMDEIFYIAKYQEQLRVIEYANYRKGSNA